MVPRALATEKRMHVSPEQQAEIDAARSENQPTRRACVADLDEILFQALPVLDHGFVRVIDYMGDDAAVAPLATQACTAP